MEQFKVIAFKKEFWIGTIIALALILYILFFKANPVVRVDWNKVSAGRGSSTLQIDAPTEVSGVGKKFTVKVVMNTQGSYVNAVSAYLKFDPKMLEIVKTDTQNSFCKFYPENNYSNEKGIVRLACGAPYPGFKGENDVVTIDFLAKGMNTTIISLEKESMVLANDGKGTNLLRDLDSAEIRIKPAL